MAKTQNIGIRLLSVEDVESYRALRLKGLQESPTSFTSSYEEEKDKGSDYYALPIQHHTVDLVGAFAGDELVGIVGVKYEERPKIQHKAHIWGLYVDPEYRGKKISFLLLEKALHLCRQRKNLRMICLCVITSNKKALSLYRSAGFVVYGEERNAMLVGDVYHDQYLMQLDLRAVEKTLQ